MALYKYHYIELDTKRSPRISLQNIVAGETGNRLWITVTNNGETVDMSEKEDGEYIYRVCLVIKSNLGVRRQDSATEDSGISFINANTGDHGKVNILLSKDTFTAGKNRARIEIYSKRVEEDDTLIVSAEWTFDVEGADEGDNVGVATPLLVEYEQKAEYFANLAEEAVQGGIVDPTVTEWLETKSDHIDGVINDEVDDWLDEHPEATTTVQDGAITDAKLSAEVKAKYAHADDVSNVKSEFNEKVNSHYTTVEPENWFDESATTDGILYANGTTGASTSQIYTDYIPVAEGDILRQYYGNSRMPKIYRNNVCCYDADKNVLANKGSDSAGKVDWTVPSGVSYVRMTIDKTYEDKAIITKNIIPTRYTAYFAPYDEITSDFLTAESEAALQGVKDETAAYGYAMPMGADIRLTVGIPEKWYYRSILTPNSLSTTIGLGMQYSHRENDGLNIPNTEALNSLNGYSFTVYNANLKPVFSYKPNSGYGLPRKIVAENLQNCSALVIGDSTVDFDTMTQKMIDYFASKSKTLTLLGTLGSGNNKNEGRAGWKAQDYLTNRQYDGVVNPFYNPTSETFDFSYYMTNQGYSAPDFVVLQLGINDLYNSGIDAIEPTWAAIKTMIDSIIAYNSTIKILLNLPTTPNSDQNKHDVFLPLYQNRVVRYNQYAQAQALSYGASKVRCTYCHLILDPATDIRDNVHPTNAGFEKMAKEVISQINVWQNGQ